MELSAYGNCAGAVRCHTSDWAGHSESRETCYGHGWNVKLNAMRKMADINKTRQAAGGHGEELMGQWLTLIVLL